MDTVFAVTTPFEGGAPEEIEQGKALTDAAIKSGVGHFIYSCVASADQLTGGRNSIYLFGNLWS